MKKVVSLLLSVAVLVVSLWAGAGSVQAAGTITYAGSHFVWGKGAVFIFNASGVKNGELKGARIFVGSNLYNVDCTFKKDEGKIVCVAGGGITQYAGQTGALYLAGQVFTVRIPHKEAPAVTETETPPTCEAPNIMGANVTFMTFSEGKETFFVHGETRAEVKSNAQGYLGEVLISILKIGDLYCKEAV